MFFFHHSWATSKDETETETVFLGDKYIFTKFLCISDELKQKQGQ